MSRRRHSMPSRASKQATCGACPAANAKHAAHSIRSEAKTHEVYLLAVRNRRNTVRGPAATGRLRVHPRAGGGLRPPRRRCRGRKNSERGCADLATASSLARDAGCRRGRGVVAYVRGDFRRARELFLEAVERYGRIGEDAVAPLAGTLLQLGEASVRLELWREAEDALRRSLNLHRSIYGPASSRAADVMASLGGLWVAQGLHAKAEPLLIEARDIHQRTQTVDTPAYAALLSHLAILY